MENKTDLAKYLKKKIELQKYNLQIYRNTNDSNAEIQNTKLKIYNLQKFRNTNDRIT